MNRKFKFRLRFALLLLIGCNMSILPSANGQGPLTQGEEANLKKVVLIITLNPQKIQTLQTTGVLTANIPPKLVGRIKAVRFKKTTSFLAKSLPVEIRTDKVNRSLSMTVDSSVIERLDFQPVEVNIYESGFNRFFMKFDPRGSVAGKIPEQVKVEPNPADSPFLFIRLGENRGIYGTLKGFNKFPVRTDFGDVEIPSKQLKGIRLNTDDNNSAYVMLHGGDEFSARVEDQKVTINTWWGPHEVSLSEIESITISEEQKFVSAKDGKWKLQSSRTIRNPPNQTPLNLPPFQRPSGNPINRFQ